MALYLKRERIPVRDLRVGDLVVDDFNVWHVAASKERSEGSFELLDDDQNGVTMLSGDWTVEIVARGCLR